MPYFTAAFLMFVAAVMTACTSTPPLSDVTGEPRGDIFVKDVVQRVKCELSDAIHRKLDKPEFSWLSNWTAHVDLTLSINDNAGISPAGSYTHFLSNAVNFNAGPSAFPATAARSVVSQFFTVSVGATLSGQAVRTEVISFTVALDELQLWRANIDSIEADPKYPDSARICNFGSATGVTGHLGLNEWVESAISPAGTGQLKAGIHSATAAKVNAPQVPQPGRTGPQSASKTTAGDLRQQLRIWADFISQLQIVQARTVGAADLQKQIGISRSAIDAAIQAATPYNKVIEPYLKARYLEIESLTKKYINHAATCAVIFTKLTADLKNAETNINTLNAAIIDAIDTEYLNSIPAFISAGKDNAGIIYRQLRELMGQLQVGIKNQDKPNIKESEYRVALNDCDKVARALAMLPNTLPKQVDPPIDALLHSVAFFVNRGASITPSWTLLQWKGPGQSPNFLAGSSARTHVLVIAMGPPGGSPPIGDEARRLLFLQELVRASGQQNVSPGALISAAP